MRFKSNRQRKAVMSKYSNPQLHSRQCLGITSVLKTHNDLVNKADERLMKAKELFYNGYSTHEIKEKTGYMYDENELNKQHHVVWYDKEGKPQGVLIADKHVLLARKPENFYDVESTVKTITPADIATIVPEGKTIVKITVKDFETLSRKNLSSNQFWKVKLSKEKETVLVDTSGYDYPRYVGILKKNTSR